MSAQAAKSPQQSGDDDDGSSTEPYSMHVSAKYLELTRRKLEFTRLPHELCIPEERRWGYGTPKSVLEPLVDFWLEQYDWRAQESYYNSNLPQYRTTIGTPLARKTESASPAETALRIHFVHKQCRLGDITPPRTSDVKVVPLLFCHDCPMSSFLDVSAVIDALTRAGPEDGDGGSAAWANGAGEKEREKRTGMEGPVPARPIAFHVVAPSIPGTGFSDASAEEGFGVAQTADVFDALMKRLGYERYVAFGAGWGFAVCRALALRHGPESCVAIHTANPASFFPPPSLRTAPGAWLRYHAARLTGARVSALRFGYLPEDFGALPALGRSKVPDEEVPSVGVDDGHEQRVGGVACISRPQTAAYALCDSPVGLLAHTLDVLRPCLVPRSWGLVSAVWSPAMLLTWTMMQWLPGPEAGLRWMQRARWEAGLGGRLWSAYSSVPLGISQFGRQRGPGEKEDGVLGWAEAWQRVSWLKRREDVDSVRPEWEAPEELVADLREGFGKVWTLSGEA